MGGPPDQGQIGPTVAMPNRAASKINCMSEVILSGWIAGDHVRIHAARGFRAFFAERQKYHESIPDCLHSHSRRQRSGPSRV